MKPLLRRIGGQPALENCLVSIELNHETKYLMFRGIRRGFGGKIRIIFLLYPLACREKGGDMYMKYVGMPIGMWALFGKSFEKSLITELGFDRDMAKSVAVKAKPRYKEIIAGLPEFEKADRNPYSWNMEFYPYTDGSGYEARFTACGICTLMWELGLYDLVPAMCRMDYTMSEVGGASDFVREYTLASGGSYCDCGYKKKWGKCE